MMKIAFIISALFFSLNCLGKECIQLVHTILQADQLARYGKLAIDEKKPFGIEIEFFGNRNQIANAIVKNYGGVIDSKVRVGFIEKGTERTITLKSGRTVRIDYRSRQMMPYRLHLEKILEFSNIEGAMEVLDIYLRINGDQVVKFEDKNLWFVFEKMDGVNNIPYPFSFEKGILKTPYGEISTNKEGAFKILAEVAKDNHNLQSSQTTYLQKTSLGNLKIVTERDDAIELVTDHTSWHHPEEYAKLLDLLYRNSATGTFSELENNSIGIHISVDSRKEKTKEILQSWFLYRDSMLNLFTPYSERYKYMRTYPDDLEALVSLNSKSSNGDIINRITQITSLNDKTREINLNDLINGKNRVEIRIFNTEDATALPWQITASLGLIKKAELGFQ